MVLKRFASIDVGPFEIELGIYELSKGGGTRLVDNVHHVTALGSDTYRNGGVSSPSIQKLTTILKDFTHIIAEYRCEAYRAIAMPVMHETTNSAVVLGQIKTRIGPSVQILLSAEQRMLILKVLAACDERLDTLVNEGAATVEVGFGSMQVNLYGAGIMQNTQNLRFGALRLCDISQQLDSAQDDRECILQKIVARELDIYGHLHLRRHRTGHMIMIGDPICVFYGKTVRAQQLSPEEGNFADIGRMKRLYQCVIVRAKAELEETLGLNSATTGVLLPAVVLYQRMTETVGAEKVWFLDARLIDDVVAGYASRKQLVRHTHDFDADVLAAIQGLTTRYGERAAHHHYMVGHMLRISNALKKTQGFTARDRLSLEITVTSHHCRRFLNMGNASESSGDIIHATEIAGLSIEKHTLIVQILRNENDVLGWHDTPLKTARFAAVIRFTNAMDRSAKQKMGAYRIRLREDGILSVMTGFSGDITLERLSFKQRIPLFSNVLGISPMFRQRKSLGSGVV